MTMETKKKKPGRPSMLTAEERRRAMNQRSNEQHKKTGYASQRKYDKEHQGEFYRPPVVMRKQSKATLDQLREQTGLSISELLLGAVEEKYGVKLLSKVDKKSP